MQNPPEFLTRFAEKATTLLKSHGVKEPVFSRGTYHVGVQEKGKKQEFSFFQMNDEGSLTDSFCSCKASEKDGTCVHLAAAYLRIFNGTNEPLHVRFNKSLWNRLFQMEAKRQGSDAKNLIKEGEVYRCLSSTKKVLFSIKPQGEKAKQRFLEITTRQEEETEETSIKFSNLSSEEIEQYRKGNASHILRYELSFWADLAKWLMELQDEGSSYTILFEGHPFPHDMKVQFEDVDLFFYISEVHLPWILPSLTTVKVPLEVIDEDSSIESVSYDEEKRMVTISAESKKSAGPEIGEGIAIGDWIYITGKGFYRKGASSFFGTKEIPEEKIGEFLSKNSKEIGKFLPIHLEPIEAKYQLHIDSGANLHIDLQDKKAALFAPWIYLPREGFYLVEGLLFPQAKKVISWDKVSDFINRHREWLHQFPGYQTHVGSLESHLTYEMTANELKFNVELNFPIEETVHFDQWIYVKGQGFYMKKESRGLPLHPGLRVKKSAIFSFIKEHETELEQVRGFFSLDTPIEKIGLSIFLNEEGLISVAPKIKYVAGVDPTSVQIFGDFFYTKGKGFSSISQAMNVPEKYREIVVIPRDQEISFCSYELEPLMSFVEEIDPHLQKPKRLQLKIRKITRDPRKKTGQWLVEFAYESDVGSTDIFAIWDAFSEKKRALFSKAGFLNLKDVRFNWIKQLPKKRLDRKRGIIKLDTLEWFRLEAFEAIEETKGTSQNAQETQKVLSEIEGFETKEILDISGLQSTLRPYQEQGVNWLWFLYCHGLSGLLCDDMGLGKTHQAMALLAGIFNADPEKNCKYLVVCPTSVIYHWEEQLKRFLPGIRVSIYYGTSRSLDNFESDYDLLLTSYGVLRQSDELVKTISFEAAFYDEIQVAKNHTSQTHQILRQVKTKMHLGLTGTPIENRIREIKALFDVVLPSYMPSDAVFREMFTLPIEKENDEGKRELLARLVKPFILRRKKSEVLRDLPEKMEEIAYCDLSREQAELYREVANEMRNGIYQDLKDASKPVKYLHVFSALSRMKQICDHPSLVSEGTTTSGKWDLFVELLSEARASNQKVVIFSQYLGMIEIIETYLNKMKIGYASIKGSTRDRNAQLRKFREDPTCEVFIGSLLAAGVGIDLTVASIVIHYDRWWNPAKENQATDRVHRIGQNRGVQVFKLVTKNTIEEDIHEIIERKKGLLEQVVGTDDQINYLSRDELLKVFEKMFSTRDTE